MIIGFAGTPNFACPAFEQLAREHDIAFVLTQPDRPRGRGQKVSPSPIKSLALHAGYPVLQPSKLTKDPWQKEIEKYPIDALIVVSYGLYIPQWLIDLPRYGCLNIHPSDLPRWRGASPIQSSLLHGDRETAVCIMKLVQEMDAGPVYTRDYLQIDNRTTYQSLHDACASLGAKLICQTLTSLPHCQPTPQTTNEVSHAPKLTKSAHYYCPDWSVSELHHHVQAFHPKPGVQVVMNCESLKIIWGQPTSIPSSNPPGTIVFEKDQWILSTVDFDYTITEILKPGKRPLPVGEYTSLTQENPQKITAPQQS